MVREEAKALSPKQCAVIELALDTIKVGKELNVNVKNVSSTVFDNTILQFCPSNNVLLNIVEI